MSVEIQGYEPLILKLNEISGKAKNVSRHLLRFAHIVAAEAKKHTPVDTGRLRASISANLKSSNEAVVGTNVNYAKFVELGHKAEILPVRAKALRFYIRGSGWVFAKRVVQGVRGKSASWEKEGGRIKKPFLKPALDFARKKAVDYFKGVFKL